MAACKITLFACFLLGSAVAYTLLTILYRLHIHPLSRFPGPRLAAITGLYEVYYAAWGAGSFDDEIDRMHRLYGPVVRITPDELHIQEQHAYTTNYADAWSKGTRALDTRHHHSGRKTRGSPIRRRSISRVRSLLQVEVRQIIRGLVQRHHFHRLLGSKVRPLFPKSDLPMIRVGDATDLEDGDHARLSSPRSSSSRSQLEY